MINNVYIRRPKIEEIFKTEINNFKGCELNKGNLF